MKALIIFPLIILFFTAILAQTGLGAQNFGTYQYRSGDDAIDNGFYDETGHLVAYENHTAVTGGDAGWLGHSYRGTYWYNGTAFDPAYPVTQGVENIGKVEFGFDFFGNMGLVVILMGVLAVALIAGIKVLGSGLAEVTVKTILIVTMFSGLWVILSLPAFNMLSSIPLVGLIAYAFLTIMYGAGCMFELSGSGDGL